MNRVILFFFAAMMVGLLVALVVYLIYSRLKSGASEREIEEIDAMDGLDFEEYAARLLRENGFTLVELTKKTGDFGADIIVEKDGEKIAVQCKRQSTSVGVKAVQEVKASERVYSCARSAVLTNAGFTAQAVKLADENGVWLWGREVLAGFVENAGKGAALSLESHATLVLVPICDPGAGRAPVGVRIGRAKPFVLDGREVSLRLSPGPVAIKVNIGRKKAFVKVEAEAGRRQCLGVGLLRGKAVICEFTKE